MGSISLIPSAYASSLFVRLLPPCLPTVRYSMRFAVRMEVILSCSLAVTRNSYSPSSSLIRGAKKLAWKGVLMATHIFLTFLLLPIPVLPSG